MLYVCRHIFWKGPHLAINCIPSIRKINGLLMRESELKALKTSGQKIRWATIGGWSNFFFFSVSFYLFIYFSSWFYFLTLQYCIGFAIYQKESATGIHVFPILNPPPSSLPIPSLWVVPEHQPQASSIVHRTWTGDSFHIWYYTYFNAILPNHPTLSLSHRVQKTVLYISVSFAVSYTGLLLPSF